MVFQEIKLSFLIYRKRATHKKMVEDLKISKLRLTKSLEETEKSLKRSNRAVRELLSLYG